MSANASSKGRSPAQLLRALAWFLCMLVVLWAAGARIVGPVAASFTSNYTPPVHGCSVDQDGDCETSEADDPEQDSDSDPETEEIPTVPDVRIWVARIASSELSIDYSGKARPGFSSPEPRPAEQV